MISIEIQRDGALLEIELSGQITAADYRATLVPAIETALREHDRIRVLVVAGENFKGFDPGAIWADTQLALGHWSGFDRLAVATDIRWLAAAVRLAAPLIGCPVRVFSLIDTETAHRWLRDPLGAVQVIDLGGPCLQVRLLGRLDPEALVAAGEQLDDRIRGRPQLRLLVDLTEFDGWQGLSALAAHFSLVREHAASPERVAVVGDTAWHHMAQRIMGRFVNAESRFFAADDFEAARLWLTG